jgi:hypothetical protein
MSSLSESSREIVVQLMSGKTHILNIFDGYRIVHTKNEIASILNVNRDLITISSRNEDGEFDVLDNMHKVEDGEYYYAFVGEEEDPPEYYMRFDQSDDIDFEGSILFVNEDGENEEESNIRKDSIIHVQLSEYGWEFVRNVLRENRYGVMYDSEDEYDDHSNNNNDRYNRLSNEDVIVSFLSLRNLSGVEIIIECMEDEDE